MQNCNFLSEVFLTSVSKMLQSENTQHINLKHKSEKNIKHHIYSLV